MKITSKILAVLLILSANIIFTQDTNIVKYFPLTVGNTWVYSGSHFSIQCQSSFRVRARVDSIVTANGKTYYRINTLTKIISGGNCSYSYGNASYRVDAFNGNLYQLIPNPTCSFSPNERVVDSLKSKLRDTAVICGLQSDPKKILRDTSINQVLGQSKQTKRFEGGNFHEFSTSNRYAKDFGIIESGQGGMSLNMSISLMGCIISGTLYGDTNFYLVSLNPISNQIPNEYNLNQNYPNPFNPVTQIKFDIPKSSFVNLIIYDVNGKEVSVLVNQDISAGSYSVDWNASAYPSGVYFYRITSGKYTETRRMVLVK